MKKHNMIKEKIEKKSRADAKSKEVKEKAAKEAEEWIKLAEEFELKSMTELKEEKKKAEKEKEGSTSSAPKPSQCPAHCTSTHRQNCVIAF